MLATGGGTAAEVLPPTDGITPDPVSVTLGKGSSTTVDSSLHLTRLPARADILLALDTTGSMQLAIDNAKADANELVNTIQAQIPGARFAVASFKDYPISPFGSTGDYPWRLDHDFTTNQGTVDCPIGVDTIPLSPIACALNGLSAGGGNDAPEAYNRAFYEADRLSWAPNAPRFMIVLGDQLPHDTQINTTFPACPNTAQNDPGPDGTPGTSRRSADEDRARRPQGASHERLVRHLQRQRDQHRLSYRRWPSTPGAGKRFTARPTRSRRRSSISSPRRRRTSTASRSTSSAPKRR